MILRRYFKWILISFAIAAPMSSYLTKMWVQEFAFGVRISPWTYLLSLMAMVCISFLTIVFLFNKSARENPSKVLKYN